ncbi:N-acyl-D-amino-acid deacylase [Kribbella sp. VKM Ac-2571]|uniref:N-acyl-D-amino-acid deacylase family protein n=1 Tax=Kribbella sp. VKM Ac-2571 TaxID=2512222 RepID=UPI0010604A5A|nr:amidohydrolase family protein [Kribbella sp. VKM Ac-2571]TDO54003.1 N-acyl-D-amino-acid deacylase [Kribbella sp. VKM Ac-2571]
MRVAVTGGLIADGTGSELVPGTVLVEGERITALLPPGEPVADAEVIDATGNIVAPGFVDLHSHADFSLGASPAAESQLAQGVTTLVAGNCGWSPFPITDLETLRAGTAFLDPLHDWSWNDLAGFAATLQPAVNLALQVGHCTLRIAAMGSAKRPPSPEELRTMQDLLRAAADQGAVGFSTGLIYAPGAYASPEEVAALVATAAECGLLYSTHIRNEGAGLLAALDEAIAAARAGGARLEISHLKAVGKSNYGLVDGALEHLEQVDDVDLGWDAYPYTATSTTLTTRLPTWALAGGALLDRLADPAERARIAEALRADDLLSPDSVVIASLPPGRYEDSRGLSLTEIAQRDGVDAAEIVLRILESHQAAVSVVNHAMSEDDVTTVLEHPRTAVASDGWIMDATGPGHPHPRNFGTFPRALGHYTRDRGILTLPEAIRRMTSLPATRLGLSDRGVIKPGAIADLTVLDADSIADKSTYDNPWQLSVGINHVLVAGQLALTKAKPTGHRPGRIIGL